MKTPKAIQGKEKQWAEVIVRTWADEGFKRNLLKDPRAALTKSGIDIPENIKINVLEAKEDEIFLTLPSKPSSEVSIEELSGRLTAWAWT